MKRNDLFTLNSFDGGGRSLGRREDPERWWTRKAFGCNWPCGGQWWGQASLELDASHGLICFLLWPVSSILNITYYDNNIIVRNLWVLLQRWLFTHGWFLLDVEYLDGLPPYLISFEWIVYYMDDICLSSWLFYIKKIQNWVVTI